MEHKTWLAEQTENVRVILERLARHAGETGRTNESPLETFDRVLLDHEKFHHGADVDPQGVH